jgi:hypothetical protein
MTYQSKFEADLAVTAESTQFIFGVYHTDYSFAVAAASSGYWIHDYGNLKRVSSSSLIQVNKRVNI